MKTIITNTSDKTLLYFLNNFSVEYFESNGKTIFKGRNIVKEFKLSPAMTIIVKSFKPLNIFKSIIYALIQSKAKRAFLKSEKLLSIGIDTPKPIAAIQTGKFFLPLRCFYISLPNFSDNLVTQLRKKDFNVDIANKLVSFLVKMHQNGMVHGDLNLTNILYDGHNFSLIDTNRSKSIKNINKSHIIRDLSRITHRRDLLRFIANTYWDTFTSTNKNINLGSKSNFIISLIHAVFRMEKKKKLLHLWKDFKKKRKNKHNYINIHIN